ncbi:hypothetical protein DPMN_070771 [Dreissena polymorpha]|uniref:C2H2-type domain-containing protein n=1 Tax=Dreissena polymorpha TaxID=45954 RepID=A0A9D3Z1Z1_DREPO|nr:hypothetical protein DPMN_070771 [Dreissena polymorpha]
MGSSDLDVIKEIPGYKVILKAVVRSQIQQLVEQLAVHTDEESVILTASVSDGTLSHLGSQSGKSFLQDNEEVKSQFLGFCLKDHHRRKLEREKQAREKLEQELLLQQQQKQQELQQQLMFNPGPQFTRSPRQFSPRYQAPRHQPYPVNRPRRPTAPNLGTGPQNNGTGQPGVVAGNSPRVKVEPSRNDGPSYQSGSELEANETRIRSSDSVSDSGANTSEQVGMGSSDSSNQAPGDIGDLEHTEGGRVGLDSGEDVKLESLEESDIDLEITGVEPGQSFGGQDLWDPSVSLTFDPTGATGSSLDVSGSQPGGYNVLSGKPHVCTVCGKGFKNRKDFVRHTRVHTGEKPFKCDTCGKRFTLKGNLKSHMVVHQRFREPWELGQQLAEPFV